MPFSPTSPATEPSSAMTSTRHSRRRASVRDEVCDSLGADKFASHRCAGASKLHLRRSLRHRSKFVRERRPTNRKLACHPLLQDEIRKLRPVPRVLRSAGSPSVSFHRDCYELRTTLRMHVTSAFFGGSRLRPRSDGAAMAYAARRRASGSAEARARSHCI